MQKTSRRQLLRTGALAAAGAGAVGTEAGAAEARFTRQAARIQFAPSQSRFLNFGQIADTTRLRTVFGFQPNYTTAEAFRKARLNE